MRRVNVNDFYQLGWAVHPLTEVRGDETVGQHLYSLVWTHDLLEKLLAGATLHLRVSRNAAQDLLNQCTPYMPKPESDFKRKLTGWEAHNIKEAAKQFEIVLAAELQTLDTYFVDQKGIYSTSDLVERADTAFPQKVRGVLSEAAIHEMQQAGRALALDLPTAVGFHVLRATESMLCEYYPMVVKDKPKQRDWGYYVKQLREHGADEKVVGTIDQIRALHRNPIMHPEDVLTEDEAMVLFGIAQSAIVALANAIVEQRNANAVSALAVASGAMVSLPSVPPPSVS